MDLTGGQWSLFYVGSCAFLYASIIINLLCSVKTNSLFEAIESVRLSQLFFSLFCLTSHLRTKVENNDTGWTSFFLMTWNYIHICMCAQLLSYVLLFATPWTVAQARILEWVAIPFSRASSRRRDQTRVSCTAGRFFTVWATRWLKCNKENRGILRTWSDYVFKTFVYLCTFKKVKYI